MYMHYTNESVHKAMLHTKWDSGLIVHKGWNGNAALRFLVVA